MIESNNLWTGTQVKESESERSSSYRKDFLRHLGYNPKKRKQYPCMLTGQVGDGEKVVAAHIAPAKSKIRILNYIGMTADDINNPRNFLLLAKNVEVCFDRQQLSFVKENPLSNDLILKIWDSSASTIPIWESSKLLIGKYDGKKLLLGDHNPFRRALSYQAYQAYIRHAHIGHSIPLEYGSDDQTTFYRQRQTIKEMKDLVMRDIKEEVESDED